MKDDLESRLRQALREPQPDAGFAERLMARIDASTGSSARPVQRPGLRRAPAARWLAAGLAACLTVSLTGILFLRWTVHEREVRERAAGIEARQQVLDALRVVDGIVGRAYTMVKQQPAAAPDDQPNT